MKKLIIASLLAIALVFLLCSCAGTSESDTQSLVSNPFETSENENSETPANDERYELYDKYQSGALQFDFSEMNDAQNIEYNGEKINITFSANAANNRESITIGYMAFIGGIPQVISVNGSEEAETVSVNFPKDEITNVSINIKPRITKELEDKKELNLQIVSIFNIGYVPQGKYAGFGFGNINAGSTVYTACLTMNEKAETVELSGNAEFENIPASDSSLKSYTLKKAGEMSSGAMLKLYSKDNETEHLFKIIRQLQEKGCAIIYISHKMDEIFEICDEISVLRDGKLVMTKPAAETNMGELITAMVGRSLESRFPPVDNKPGDTILSVQHLSTKYAPYLQDVSFDVREGEIFGLYGLVGAGRTELLETIFGVRTRAAGRVYFKNRLMNFSNAKEAIEHGFAMITEERKANGLFLKCDLTFNTTIANLRQYKSGPALSTPKMVKATNKEIKTMRTKCMGPDDMITSLSGGNQQKVIFGKWLEREPQVFMMDEPTRGIDVGAKYEIYELIIRMAKQGKTIIVVSSEMPEILGITNRIGVMSNGHLSGIVNTKETDQEELLRLSAKYL